MEIPLDWIILYFLAINTLALALFGLDKAKARKRKRRISEASLFTVSFLGGAFGGILGMLAFRHKTRKVGFKIVMALALLVNVAAYAYLLDIPFK